MQNQSGYKVVQKNLQTGDLKQFQTQEDPRQYALNHPRGLYTVARTVNQSQNVLEWQMHVNRLYDVDDTDQMKSVIESSLKSILKEQLIPFYENGKECKIAVFKYDSENGNKMLDVLLSELPAPAANVQVELSGPVRTNATVKDTQWIKDRDKLITKHDAKTHEIILYNGNDIYEGATSNFFAISELTIQTAPLDVVLAGTVQNIIIKVFESKEKFYTSLNQEEKNILNLLKLEFKFPNWQDINQWSGCFITSTSRPVVGIQRLRLPSGEWIEFNSSQDKIIKLLQKLVQLSLINQSEKIL